LAGPSLYHSALSKQSISDLVNDPVASCRKRQQGRLMKLTIGTRHLFLRALLSGKTGSAAAKQHQKKSENKYHPELVFCSEQTSTVFLKKT